MTTIEIEKNKETFIEIFNTNIKREGADGILDYLCKTDFFTAPASGKYHLSEDGGLCKHSLNVYYRLIKILKDEYGDTYAEKFDLESITIISLLHDICKINFYKKDTKNVKINGQWTTEPFYKVEEQFHFGHGAKSVFMIQHFIKLFLEEALAIRFHMGGLEYSGSSFVEPNVADVYSENPIAFYLHLADMEATYIDEGTYNDKRP